MDSRRPSSARLADREIEFRPDLLQPTRLTTARLPARPIWCVSFSAPYGHRSDRGAQLMQAIIRAVDDGADIINLSLAQTGGWTLRPLSVFLTRVIETAKIFVVVRHLDCSAS